MGSGSDFKGGGQAIRRERRENEQLINSCRGHPAVTRRSVERAKQTLRAAPSATSGAKVMLPSFKQFFFKSEFL